MKPTGVDNMIKKSIHLIEAQSKTNWWVKISTKSRNECEYLLHMNDIPSYLEMNWKWKLYEVLNTEVKTNWRAYYYCTGRQQNYDPMQEPLYGSRNEIINHSIPALVLWKRPNVSCETFGRIIFVKKHDYWSLERT